MVLAKAAIKPALSATRASTVSEDRLRRTSRRMSMSRPSGPMVWSLSRGSAPVSAKMRKARRRKLRTSQRVKAVMPGCSIIARSTWKLAWSGTIISRRGPSAALPRSRSAICSMQRQVLPLPARPTTNRTAMRVLSP